MFLPRLSITTWWWQRRLQRRPLTTTSCFSTASCPIAPPPLPPSCTSTSQGPPRLVRWRRPPTVRATRAAAAAWFHPAASVTLTPHTRLYTRAHTPHTLTPGWWPAGAALKPQWQLFTAGYPMLYHWTDSWKVKTTLWVQQQSCKKCSDSRVKFDPETRLAPSHQTSESSWSRQTQDCSRRAPILQFPSQDWLVNCTESSLKGNGCGHCFCGLISNQKPAQHVNPRHCYSGTNSAQTAKMLPEQRHKGGRLFYTKKANETKNDGWHRVQRTKSILLFYFYM